MPLDYSMLQDGTYILKIESQKLYDALKLVIKR